MNPDFADNLRRMLTNRSMSQAALTRAAGIPKSTLNDYIQGKSEPKEANLLKIAAALKVNPGELLGLGHKDIAGFDPEKSPHIVMTSGIMEKLDAKGQMKAVEYVQDLLYTGRYNAVKPDSERTPAHEVQKTERTPAPKVQEGATKPDKIKSEKAKKGPTKQESANKILEPDSVDSVVGQKEDIEEIKEPIAVYSVGRVGAGGGIINGDPDEIYSEVEDLGPLAFDFSVVVCGDSMEPNIKDQDLVLVSAKYDKINGAIYVFDLDGENFVKRLYFEPNRIKVKSDNKAYKDWYIIDDPFKPVRILGKVVASISPMLKGNKKQKGR